MDLLLRDIVKIFQVSEQTIQTWIGKKNMPFMKANDQYSFNYIEILDWALEQKINLTQEALAFGDSYNQHPTMLYQAIKNGQIHYDIPGDTRETVLKSIVDVLSLPKELNKKSLLQMLISREKMMSTGLGNGIAIPHVRNPVVLNIEQPSISLCFLNKPVDFKALDAKPVFILFVLLSPSVPQHLAILSRLAFCLQNPKLQEFLHAKASCEQILAEIRVLESKIAYFQNEQQSEEDKA
ncbi:MAG: PTS sugar transporter subunit IIA [Candidatus Omnitrophica bacterium]|nr:PTS sugar transporter subunit IIA [Candidatus Omnitrophota bacterium]